MQQIMGSLQVVFCSDVRNHRKIVKWLNIPTTKVSVTVAAASEKKQPRHVIADSEM
jgi:16S rRNA C1402 (ribose-2'-O) methylase RsmI